jgi:hypothetical protein
MLVPSDSTPVLAPQLPEYQPLLPAHLAGEEISGASRRLRALAALSGSLTDALGPGEAADLVELKALSALGATSAVVVTLGAFPPPIAPSVRAFAPTVATTLTLSPRDRTAGGGAGDVGSVAARRARAAGRPYAGGRTSGVLLPSRL